MQYDHALSGCCGSRRWSRDKQMSTKRLVGLIAQGDKHAMQVLFARHTVRMFRIPNALRQH